MREVELKFALAAQSVPALCAAPALAGLEPRRADLLSIYFDTPSRELAAREMALRLRACEGRWVQSLKAGGSGLGGLHARDESEHERPDASIDLSLFAATPLAGLPDAATLHERLAEAFRVEMRRTKWIVEPGSDSRLEVALDEGRVRCGERESPFCEVEVEVLAGDVGAAFDFASSLIELAPLRPSAVTKAQRGYRLLTRSRARPVKAGPVSLERSTPASMAARAVLAAGLAQLQANEEGVLSSSDPEFVHQARVALRRMRSALRIFREVIGVERSQQWRDALADVAAALGAARDWEVFATEVLPPLLDAFDDPAVSVEMSRKAARRRARERKAAREAFLSQTHARVVLDLARWLAIAEPPAEEATPLPALAAKVIRKRHKRLLRDAARIRDLSAEERHRIRIDAKRLRYGVDALASLYKPKRVERYLDVLGALQDALGAANDAATATRLVGELDPPERLSAFARGWLAAIARGDPVVFDVLVETLRGTSRFWEE